MMNQNIKTLTEEYSFDTVVVRQPCLQLSEVFPGKNMRDISIGLGWMAIVLVRTRFKVTTVDIDRDAWQYASELAHADGGNLFNRIPIEYADATQFSHPDFQFDTVLPFDSMHHLADCHRVLKEICPLCKPGSRVAISGLIEKELAAVRTGGKNGKNHYENTCWVDLVGDVRRQNINSSQR